MSEPERFPARPMVLPTLVELQVDPSALDRLPLDTLVALRRQLRVLAADLEKEITARLLVRSAEDRSAEIGLLTTARLAQLWSMPTAKVRELCRTGRIPARKLGPKEWVVPVAELRAWARQGIVEGPGPGHNTAHAAHREAAPRARLHTVEIRRPAPPESA